MQPSAQRKAPHGYRFAGSTRSRTARCLLRALGLEAAPGCAATLTVFVASGMTYLKGIRNISKSAEVRATESRTTHVLGPCCMVHVHGPCV